MKWSWMVGSMFVLAVAMVPAHGEGPPPAQPPSDFAVDRANSGSSFASEYNGIYPTTTMNGMWGMMEMMQMQEWYLRRNSLASTPSVPYAFPRIQGQRLVAPPTLMPSLGNGVPAFTGSSMPTLTSPLPTALGPRVPGGVVLVPPGLPVPGGNPNK